MSRFRLFIALLAFWSLGAMVESLVNHTPEAKKGATALASCVVSSVLAALLASHYDNKEATR